MHSVIDCPRVDNHNEEFTIENIEDLTLAVQKTANNEVLQM